MSAPRPEFARVVVAYDIVSDKRRRRFHKRLHRYLLPVQKSVFHGTLPHTLYAEINRLVERELDLETDRVNLWTTVNQPLRHRIWGPPERKSLIPVGAGPIIL